MDLEFLEQYKDKIDLAKEVKERFDDVAMLMLSCYIEAFGQMYYFPREDSKKIFVDVLCELGSGAESALISTRQLQDVLERKPKAWMTRCLDKLPIAVPDHPQTMERSKLLSVFEPHLSSEDHQRLDNQLWRATLAAIAYEQIRCKAVHKSLYWPVVVGGRRLEYEWLLEQAETILDELIRISKETGKLCGHDFRLPSAS